MGTGNKRRSVRISMPGDEGYDMEAGQRMLQYWTALSALFLYEQSLEVFISWLPFYYEMKTCLLIWLIVPHSNAPGWLYVSVISPTVANLSRHWSSKLRPKMARLLFKVVPQLQLKATRAFYSLLSQEEQGAWRSLLYRQQSDVRMEKNRRLQQSGSTPPMPGSSSTPVLSLQERQELLQRIK